MHSFHAKWGAFVNLSLKYLMDSVKNKKQKTKLLLIWLPTQMMKIIAVEWFMKFIWGNFVTSGVFKNSKLILQFCDSNYKQYVIVFSKESVAAKEHLTTVLFFCFFGGGGVANHVFF